jgi:deoxyribonuclease V
LTGFNKLPKTPSEAIALQKEMAGKVVTSDDYGMIERVCGVDVSYRKNVAYCSAVVMDFDLNVLEQADTQSPVTQPYIPGLFMLREAGPILQTLEKASYDLLLVDGNGQLHPRKCGLACFIGLTVNKPTIGVAKSRLCGTVRGYRVELGGETLGKIVNGLYVSVGHRVSLDTAVQIVKKLSRNRMPEPLRLADMASKKMRRAIMP